jgi:hypothetical protein
MVRPARLLRPQSTHQTLHRPGHDGVCLGEKYTDETRYEWPDGDKGYVIVGRVIETDEPVGVKVELTPSGPDYQVFIHRPPEGNSVSPTMLTGFPDPNIAHQVRDTLVRAFEGTIELKVVGPLIGYSAEGTA